MEDRYEVKGGGYTGRKWTSQPPSGGGEGLGFLVFFVILCYLFGFTGAVIAAVLGLVGMAAMHR
jgi:hypothetical protein